MSPVTKYTQPQEMMEGCSCLTRNLSKLKNRSVHGILIFASIIFAPLFQLINPPSCWELLVLYYYIMNPPEKKRYWFLRDFNLPGDWTSDLYKDRKGNIWISSTHIYKYEPPTRNFTIIPNCDQLLSIPFVITEDTAGNIWMAGHGLARYNTLNLNKYDLVIDSFPYSRMMDKQVNAVVIDNRNTVWFNSNNNGLSSYDIASKTFHHFTRANGLPDDNIASLIIAGNKFWIACYSGIACMDLQTNEIVSFGKEDGFPELPIVKGARFYYDEPAKELYIGFATAVVRFNPDDVLKRKASPYTFIENIVFNGEKNNFLPGPNLSTSWKDNEIRITIGTINFSGGNTQAFAYRILKDKNTPWTSIGSQSSFTISSLSPGTHRIQVKSYAPNNRWPEQIKEISIIVLPPIWGKKLVPYTGWWVAPVSFLPLHQMENRTSPEKRNGKNAY